ncbi:unnamed protein product [Taenia asiatica]|uniref:Uncharacterized protein n=1 Tax=Taenia asiatica TaxID=60517 RepID=A0A0R3W7C1_TAEAS|nr:unnamed protein product [Taenia asiatica]
MVRSTTAETFTGVTKQFTPVICLTSRWLRVGVLYLRRRETPITTTPGTMQAPHPAATAMINGPVHEICASC